jgi:MFS family permease
MIAAVVILFSSSAFSVTIEIATSEDQSTVIINDAPDQEVYVIGKSVVVHKNAKGVLAVGGDVIVEGRVEGDVATIGGNVIQKENAYIGGDIIVFGGSYKPESASPLREAGKETVTFGVFEEEIRDLGQNPSQIFAPALTVGFVAQRFVLALFWFIISLVLATLAPGAISRAVARLHLSGLKVTALGSAVFIAIVAGSIGGALLLPNYLSVTLAFMGMLLLLLGYVFGRVALQVSFGKLIQKHLFPENNRSETLAILAGVVFWTVLLSLPYIWIFALFAVFVIGIGLVLTGRVTTRWQNP